MPDPILDTPKNVMRALLEAPPTGENDWEYIKCARRKIDRSR